MSGINKDLNYVSGSHEAIAVGSTAGGTGFTAGKMALTVGNRPRSATMAVITCEGGTVYYTTDGTVPLADGSLGHRIQDGEQASIKPWLDISRFLAIALTGQSAILKVTYKFDSAMWQ